MASGSKSGRSALFHGSLDLPAVVVDSTNIELKDDEGFVGDQVSKKAFRALVEEWRGRMRELGPDPLADRPSETISKKRLDEALTGDAPLAAGVVFSAVEEFAQGLARLVRRFLRQKGWRDTSHIVVGGGLRDSLVGRLAIARAAAILRGGGLDIVMEPIRNHPDDAGLIGAVHLAPAWIFAGYDSLLAVDIGGSNIRAGVIETHLKKAPDLSRVAVFRSEIWRHVDDEPSPSRDEAVDRLIAMLTDLIRRAERADLALAPFIGIGCPGRIEPDGTIARGGQNLPGDWEGEGFNLPGRILAAIPRIGDHDTMVVMHNDAVVQGLSEVPHMHDVARWGVLTIGTGLGNARFTSRQALPEDA
ncbi:glucokinase [Methylobacterium sp. Leaf399]|uniref:ROK family protein n=1 Tax=unclassified Methylobacterium TaxID=2615210 RepID=UPI0006FE3AD1|nr:MULTISPECIES: ROK family protein [unclassified Methylobacterium]KQT09183.1 glucokinase [Methylobacterium sp. Leaf399]KQT78892.1 glucokinase [Methylobacterium sp. Leaf466]